MGMKKSEAKTNAAIRMIHLLRGEKFIQSVQPRHILTGVVFRTNSYRIGNDFIKVAKICLCGELKHEYHVRNLNKSTIIRHKIS